MFLVHKELILDDLNIIINTKYLLQPTAHNLKQIIGAGHQILALTLGDDVQSGPKTMCKCTSFGHDDVRREIVAQDMKSIPEVMQKLHWTTPDGCASCRPALNYYLVCDWPDEYADDYQSRYINERVHANIQKDGTYSVVPRMWGGISRPTQSSGGGTSGRSAHSPKKGTSLSPNAAWTVKISLPSTRPTARA